MRFVLCNNEPDAVDLEASTDGDDAVGVQRWVALQSDMYGWLLSTVAREKFLSREFVAQFVLLAGNFGMQIFFVQCIQWLNKEFYKHDSSCKCTLLIQYASVFFWELEMWSEITETLDLAELIFHVPNTSESSHVEDGYSAGEDDSNQRAGQSATPPGALGPSFWRRQTSQDHFCIRGWSSQECLSLLWPGHLAMPRKVFFVVFILVPKLIVALLLSYVGGVYIFLSLDDEKVILSVVAAEFILRIDEVLFASFAIPEISSLMKKAQPIGFHMSEGTFWTVWRTSSFLCMTVDPLIVFMIAYSVLVFGVEEEKCPSEEQWWL
eukprot:gnl/TRDRNA2_/TRDRNA2_148220_c0_seq1.p1 gnl/TRDRNA2_/TRDRNA2_148220_c0~~gnl/TRDRNA2_/TRDRNA2_148220_c0_seq1.p1  ORF type:complete len:322 (-),score=55.05 gnl/TRDRNA2_/TRDRNA2_148220_c0_seq1:364-1329(-)